jgi:hypothetical protein
MSLEKSVMVSPNCSLKIKLPFVDFFLVFPVIPYHQSYLFLEFIVKTSQLEYTLVVGHHIMHGLLTLRQHKRVNAGEPTCMN